VGRHGDRGDGEDGQGGCRHGHGDDGGGRAGPAAETGGWSAPLPSESDFCFCVVPDYGGRPQGLPR
jgi:hypothetical protein